MKKRVLATFLTFVLVMALNTNVYAKSLEATQEGGYETLATDTDVEAGQTEPESVVDEEGEEAEGIQLSVTPNYGYVDIGVRAEYYTPAYGIAPINAATLPTSYDARTDNRITPVKNQGIYGSCWAFAAMGAGEASLISQGLFDISVDLSEYQFAYFFYHGDVDPLGNLAGDFTKNKTTDYLNQGGNNLCSMFALATWRAGASEEKAPYGKASPSATLSDSLAFDDIAHMQNARMVSMKNEPEVKSLIQEYGALACSVYYDTANYYNQAEAAYYYYLKSDNESVKSVNHGINIIGWNDSFPRTYFKGQQPSRDGAWLIKNSWGPNNTAYFWVSYEDACLSEQDAFAFIFEKADNYDYNYQYDGSASVKYAAYKNGDSLANVYTVSGSVEERLDAVSIALLDTNVQYSIQIYKNPKKGNPTSGTPLLPNPQVGRTTYAGYYTIKLDTTPVLKNGDQFAVVFTLTNLNIGEDNVLVFVDRNYDAGWIEFISHTESEQMYLYSDSGCEDLALIKNSDGLCPRIKAFTTDVSSGTYSLNDVTATVSDQQYTGTAILPKPVVKYGSLVLKENEDYTLSYSNNTKIGTATITINGKGKFIGSKKVTFQIKGLSNPTTVYNGVDYSAVYDYNYYVSAYPDIFRAFGTNDKEALKHFVTFGMKEGRQGCEKFNVYSYAYKYADLRKAFKNNLPSYYMHYVNHGKKEGRVATGTTTMQNCVTVYNGVDYSAVYDYNYYTGKYADIKKTFGLDDTAALTHFVNNGMKESRQGCANFEVYSYAYKYADLRRAFKNNLPSYYRHYISNGKKEGRVATGTTGIQNCTTIYNGVDYSAVYDGSYYYNKYADLRRGFGLDDEALLKHFINYGMSEGRQGKATFNVQTYRNRYVDLQRAFGSNLKFYYLHYINNGIKEGRKGI